MPGSSLTGFALTRATGGTFATSTQVTGQVFAADYTAPTPTTLTTAVADMQNAFSNATARTNPDFLNLGAGKLALFRLRIRFINLSNLIRRNRQLKSRPWSLQMDHSSYRGYRCGVNRSAH